MNTPDAVQLPWHGQPYSVKRHGVTVDSCDTEPVQTPGCIQCHGGPIVLRATDLVILQVSETQRGGLELRRARCSGSPRLRHWEAAMKVCSSSTCALAKPSKPGLPLQRILSMLSRLHGRDQYGGGTGAGLTIVKTLIERHAGLVWLESTLGQGTIFYFPLGGAAS